MPLPNAIIIGAQKAGTTSLFDWIAQHPEVYGEKAMKDFPFFANNRFYSKGLEWFSKSFENHKNEKIILHGYVNYLYFSKMCSIRISKDLGKNIKLIVILRNPIDRAYSAFWQQRKAGYEDIKSFEEALKAEKKRLLSNDFNTLANFTYIDHGFYLKQIKDFKNIFGDNLKIIIFEEMIKNKEQTIQDIYKFLKIDYSYKPIFNKLNESGLPKSFLLQKFITNLKLPEFISDKIPINLKIKIRSSLKQMNIKKFKTPPMLPETRSFLKEIYKNEIIELSLFLNKDLSFWIE